MSSSATFSERKDGRGVYETEGRFWDPASPDNQVRGRLSWDRRRGVLALEDVLRRVKDASHDELDVIAGRSLNGDALCLRDCFVIQTTGALVQHPQQWSVQSTLVGVDAPPATLSGLELRVPAMREFYGQPVVDNQSTQDGPCDRVTIDWRSSPTLEADIEGFRIVFDDDWKMSGLVSDLRFQAIPRVRFLAQNSATEDELDQLLAPLQSFVSVFAGKDLEIGEGQLILNDGTSILRLHGWRTVLGPDRTRPWLAIGNLHPLSETFKRWYALSLRLPTGMAMLTEYLRVGPAAPTEAVM